MARKSRKHQISENASSMALPAAWVYARISNENDHAETSIENQIAICKDYITTSDGLTFGGAFTDLGYSGTNMKRPGYSDMIAGILCGSVKCVITKDLSRLGRTYIDVGELLFDTFLQCGVRFISVNDDYDSFADDAGRKKLLVLFKNLVNHMYSLDLRKKIQSSLALKRQMGEPLGLPPYGYIKSADRKRFEIDCGAAKTVEMIFNMRLQGKSTYCIAKHLNQNHILAPKDYRSRLNETTRKNLPEQSTWSANTVSRILNNETYTGSLIQEQRIIKENAHPAIISRERFQAVAHLMQETSTKYKCKNENTIPEKRYSGKVFCSLCGKLAVRCESRQGDRVIFHYRCRYCIEGLNRTSNLPVAKLDIIVMETLRKCMDILPRFERLVEVLSKSDLFRRKRASLARDRADLEKTISKHDETILAAYTHHLSGLIDIREYKLVRDKIESDKLNAEAQLAQIVKEQEKYDVQHVRNNQWLVKFSEFRDHKTLTKEMIQTLIGRVSLNPLSNEVTIELNYMDSFEELRQLMQECGIDC